MSWAQWLSSYINLNILIILGYLSLHVLNIIQKVLGLKISFAQELKMHYQALLFLMIFTFAQPWVPSSQVFAPPLKVWAAPSIQNFSDHYSKSYESGFLSLPNAFSETAFKAEPISHFILIILSLLFLIAMFLVIKDLMILFKIKKNSFLIRKIGPVSIMTNANISVPFSFWIPFKALILIPSHLLQHTNDYRISVFHELQHQRQKDTQWVYLIWFLKVICFFNPIIHLWNRKITETQEFACDETLVDQGKVDSQSYARCLVKVAQTALDQKNSPVSATGAVYLIEGHLLKRRIEKMLGQKIKRENSKIYLISGVLLTCMMGVTAFASKSLIQDKRINLDQAQMMAKKAQKENSDFPIVVNDLVLKQLNRFLGTPEGRDYMRESLSRMESHKEVISLHLDKYNMPQELMALPIIESGYRNLEQGHFSSTNKSAGLWQFIPSTARVFGLKVDKQIDERLDVPRNTDAAMRYLKSNFLRFQDWQLSVMAYNMGENALQKGLDDLQSRDAWELIKKGHEGDKNYLAKFMAAVIIMRNPEVTQ
jgi:membrane-bound lytic murein transglycosylase D